LLVITAALGPYLPLPYSPAVPDLVHISAPPFSGAGRHWLGTDPLGRDVLAALVFGARTMVVVSVPAALLAALVGTGAGSLAGFWGNALRLPAFYCLAFLGLAWWLLGLPAPELGLVGLGLCIMAGLAQQWLRPPHRLLTWPLAADTLVLGAITVLSSVPKLVLIIVLAAGTGLSQLGLLALLALTSWPSTARLVRAEMLRVRALPFIEAAQANGLSPRRIWLRHALPHAIQPVRAALPLSIAGLVSLESTLSFLGLGLPPEVASWGRLLSAARVDLAAWWVFTLPTICLVLTTISLRSLSRHQR
jgi:peptide/nickel transport system permease protein